MHVSNKLKIMMLSYLVRIPAFLGLHIYYHLYIYHLHTSLQVILTNPVDSQFFWFILYLSHDRCMYVRMYVTNYSPIAFTSYACRFALLLISIIYIQLRKYSSRIQQAVSLPFCCLLNFLCCIGLNLVVQE